MLDLKTFFGTLALTSSLTLMTGCDNSTANEPVLETTLDQGSALLYHIKSQNYSPNIFIGSSVSAKKEVLLTAQIPSRVTFIAGKEGQAFKAGTLLFTLDDSALQAKLQAARAQETAAIASIRNAGAQLNREIHSPGISSNAPGGMALPSMMDRVFTNPMQGFMGMREQGAERHADLVARQTGVDQARANLGQIQSQIKEIQSKLRDSQGIAPFNGVIVQNFVEIGDTVQPGQQMQQFADTTQLKVDADMPLRLRGGMRLGQTLQVKLDSISMSVPATVSRIHPTADRIRRTVRVELDLPTNPLISAGMYAKVIIPDATSRGGMPVITIPASAVLMRGGLPLVFIVDQRGNANVRMVRTGETTPNGNVIILSGLNIGEYIVKSPLAGMQSGDPIH